MAFTLHASGPITAAQAKKQRRALIASMGRDLRTKDRATLKRLRAAVREKRIEKKERIAEVRKMCREAIEVARERARERKRELRDRQKREAHELRAQLRAERKVQRATLSARRRKVRDESTAAVDEAKRALELEREEQHERHGQVAMVASSPKRSRAEAARARHEEQHESDDEVRRDIPEELAPVWEKVKRGIHATPRMSRTEAFLQWVHDNSADVMHLIDESLHEDLEQLERQEKSHAREMKKPGRYKRSPAHLAADLGVDEKEYREGFEHAQREIEQDNWSPELARTFLEQTSSGKQSPFSRGYDDAVRRRAGTVQEGDAPF